MEPSRTRKTNKQENYSLQYSLSAAAGEICVSVSQTRDVDDGMAITSQPSLSASRSLFVFAASPAHPDPCRPLLSRPL